MIKIMIEKLAASLGIRNDIPNQQLAKELAEKQDRVGIKEIVDNLKNKNKDIQSDCIKVLYETGYIDPELIKGYVSEFMPLLFSKNNRLVWGGMIALSTIADKAAPEIYGCLDTIIRITDNGSVITVDNGIRTLSKVASTNEKYSERILPYLLKHLDTCKPRDIARHAEYMMCAVNHNNRNSFIEVLKKREISLNASELKRIYKIYRIIEK
jgi:hypothetical protein